jgi:hypothetical protein
MGEDMKSAKEFWDVIGIYNTTLLWLQFVLVGLLIVGTVACFIKKSSSIQVILKIILSGCFGFIGIVFFIICDKSALGRFLGAPVYISIGVMFLIDIWWKRIEFAIPIEGKKKGLTIFLFLIYLLYPLVSYLIGHSYPRIVLYLMPCPLVYYTTVLLSANINKVNSFIYYLLIFWGMTGLPKAIFGAYEDLILFLGGIYALILLIKNYKTISLHNKIL